MPSSLTIVLSRAWVSSTRLPVSVCGTVGATLARGFSRRHSRLVRVRCYPFTSPQVTPVCWTDLPIQRSYLQTRTSNPGRATFVARPPFARNAGHRSRNIDRAAIAYPSRFGLGPTNLQRTNLPEEPLGFRRTGFSPVFSLLIPAFSLPPRPPLLPVRLQPTTERSPTNQSKTGSLASVPSMSPLTLSAQDHIRPVSCYALFQWWLLLSQHPGCLRAPTSFYT